MSRIFITGVAGFLGSNLAQSLIEQGHQIVGCDNLIGGDLENLPKDVEFFQYDCCDFDKMSSIIKNVEIVYHLACYPHEGLSVFSPSLVTNSVLGASSSVFSAAIKNGCKRIVFASSMARYGTNVTPFKESLPPLPQDPYGIAKVAAEDVGRILCNVHGVEWTVAVPHNIYGKNQKYNDFARNVLGIFINLMLQGRQPYVYGDGSQTRCFTSVEDAVSPLIKMGYQDNVLNKTINIGPDTEFITILEVAKLVAELIGIPFEPNFMPGRPQEVHHAVCSSNLARELLNYETTVTLRQGLLNMIEYVKTRGIKEFTYHLPIEIPSEKCPKTWSKKLF